MVALDITRETVAANGSLGKRENRHLVARPAGTAGPVASSTAATRERVRVLALGDPCPAKSLSLLGLLP